MSGVAGAGRERSAGRPRIAIAGGGAAGFFAAITAAELAPGAEVVVLEKSSQFLSKVRISGGGRCNVTHALFDAREFTRRYPRGEKTLIGPLRRFSAKDTAEWFRARGVRLKTEPDGRMFPITDRSGTIIDCLLGAARAAGVRLLANRGVEAVEKRAGGFRLRLSNGEEMECARLLLATGGTRTAALGALAESLGHTLEPPVPSLFTFHIEAPWVRELAGVSVPVAEVSVPEGRLRERGALLFTHWGLSGPAVLRVSAWGARVLHGLGYRFRLLVNWMPEHSEEEVRAALGELRRSHSAKLVVNTPPRPLTSRLWEKLVEAAGIGREARWAGLSRSGLHALTVQLIRTELPVSGKSLNKDEFVTCGGVRLREVNFKTMESKICPGLHFAGELLDIDGITGGFNFQAAWTTGWLAGKGMGEMTKVK